MQRIIFDLEADNLLEKVSKIHCLSYVILGNSSFEIQTIFDYQDMKSFFSQPDTIYIGHNVSAYDLLVAEKILGISENILFEDTLYLSQYIFPIRTTYSLESFGKDFNIEKVQISDWENLSKEDYKLRCETDVKINFHLYFNIMNKILFIYNNNKDDVKKLIKYLSLKSMFAQRQIKNSLYIDREKALDLLSELGQKREMKVEELRRVMPKVPKYSTKIKPKVMYKSDGKLSKMGESFIEFCYSKGLNYETVDNVKYVSSYSEPNPLSILQVKNWLSSLGWVPATIKQTRDKETNKFSMVPQVYKEDKSLCNSVQLLIEKEPAIENLEGLGILNHRIEQIEGLLKYSNENGTIIQELPAITPTFRYRHGKVVNLPSVEKPYGKEIRSLFKAPEGYSVVGCDIKALEDQCKLNYISPIDPEYVKEISKPGYDPHLALAVSAGFLTQEQADQHKKGEANFSKERKLGKICNFSSQYSVGKSTLAKNTGLSEYEAGKLLDAYWSKNWAIKKFASMCKTFLVSDVTFGFPQNEEWVKSPLTGFWMHLRAKKDIFSATTQSAGVYVFDNFLAEVTFAGILVPLQMHDEILFYCKKGYEEETKNILLKCIENVNKRLKLNVIIEIDIKFGDNYAEVH